MSFLCGKCGKTSKPGTQRRVLVSRTREKIYYNYRGEPAGTGVEIVTETACCEDCWKKGEYS